MSRRRHYDRPRHGYGRRGRGHYGYGHRRGHHGIRWSTVVIWIMVIVAIGSGGIQFTGK